MQFSGSITGLNGQKNWIENINRIFILSSDSHYKNQQNAELAQCPSSYIFRSFNEQIICAEIISQDKITVELEIITIV